MRRTRTLFVILLSLVMLSAGANFSSALARVGGQRQSQKRDRIISTRTVRGTLKGFEVGDYVHAVIKLENGKEDSYFIGSPGLDYFLALHKDEPLVLTVQVVDSYIPEAGGRQRIDRVSGARAGRLTSAAWWRKMRAQKSVDQIDALYREHVERLRLNP